ncbi:ATP-grasp domain-containing protein [Streptantibioticus ferralitis]|uniref:ATP-grasp domain-containing protein n=1 Tax=Streptantibioticus ferralitis TaxID=236510 RepID=A0ABT5ZB37_9ACTN|nr:ATP-grasp domain-containing protein [Streptantibioticus ferralitis]MDF2261056.1 ATP-grasp domain-containing protein [Streptantibioticus ferralitis]
MRLYLLALNPTDSVTDGFLPAAERLGLDVTVLTDDPASHHRARYPSGVEVIGCDVREVREVIGAISQHRAPDAVFSNSDHLQVQTALVADYFGLPGKDWRVALRTKNKAQLRRHLAARGADTVWCAELPPDQDPGVLPEKSQVRYPCVIKPREGVASEDVVLAEDDRELVARCARIQARRPGAALIVEEFLAGGLRTLETLGDGTGARHVLGGFRTELSPLPYFIEERLVYDPEPSPGAVVQVLAQLDALGVAFGACHTEYVVRDGRARLIEVNYRAIGDHGDLLLGGLLGIPLFERILRVHLGEPLPADLGVRTDGRARVDYPYADRAGTLTAAPEATERTLDGVRLTYRPLRPVGERHALYHTNRDYLGVLRTTGTDQAAVDRAAAEFLAAQRWEIAP